MTAPSATAALRVTAAVTSTGRWKATSVRRAVSVPSRRTAVRARSSWAAAGSGPAGHHVVGGERFVGAHGAHQRSARPGPADAGEGVAGQPDAARGALLVVGRGQRSLAGRPGPVRVRDVPVVEPAVGGELP